MAEATANHASDQPVEDMGSNTFVVSPCLIWAYHPPSTTTCLVVQKLPKSSPVGLLWKPHNIGKNLVVETFWKKCWLHS